MGQHVSCTDCAFEFFGGHDHHAGAARVVCVSCLSRFALCTKSEWGPSVGEQIPLFLTATAQRLPSPNKKRHVTLVPLDTPSDTGAVVHVSEGPPETIGDHTFAAAIYEIESVQCPTCDQCTLRMGFANDDLCPECETGKLEMGGIMY